MPRKTDIRTLPVPSDLRLPDRQAEVVEPGAIKQLGPAFGSKYLYFAGGGARDHPSLILDARVARPAGRHFPQSVDGTHWRTAVYTELMAQWSKQLSTAQQPVTGDMLEFALFDKSSRP